MHHCTDMVVDHVLWLAEETCMLIPLFQIYLPCLLCKEDRENKWAIPLLRIDSMEVLKLG